MQGTRSQLKAKGIEPVDEKTAEANILQQRIIDTSEADDEDAESVYNEDTRPRDPPDSQIGDISEIQDDDKDQYCSGADDSRVIDINDGTEISAVGSYVDPTQESTVSSKKFQQLNAKIADLSNQLKESNEQHNKAMEENSKALKQVLEANAEQNKLVTMLLKQLQQQEPSLAEEEAEVQHDEVQAEQQEYPEDEEEQQELPPPEAMSTRGGRRPDPPEEGDYRVTSRLPPTRQASNTENNTVNESTRVPTPVSRAPTPLVGSRAPTPVVRVRVPTPVQPAVEKPQQFITSPSDSDLMRIQSPQAFHFNSPGSAQPTTIFTSAPKDLAFQHFKAKNPSWMEFNTWRKSCLLEISVHPVYKSMVLEDEEGNLSLDPNMSSENNKKLCVATTKVLGPEVKLLIGDDLCVSGNGLALWAGLQEVIAQQGGQGASLLASRALLDTFKKLVRGKQEAYLRFATRFENQILILRNAQCTIPSKRELVDQFLDVCDQNNEPQVFSQVRQLLETPTYSFLLSKSFRDLASWMHQHHTNAALTTRSIKAPISFFASKWDDKEVDVMYKQETKNPYSSSSAFKRLLEKETTSDGAVNLIRKTHYKNKSACHLHANKEVGADHPFIQCGLLKKMCHDCGHQEAYKRIQNSLEYSGNAGRDTNNNTQTTTTSRTTTRMDGGGRGRGGRGNRTSTGDSTVARRVINEMMPEMKNLIGELGNQLREELSFHAENEDMMVEEYSDDDQTSVIPEQDNLDNESTPYVSRRISLCQKLFNRFRRPKVTPIIQNSCLKTSKHYKANSTPKKVTFAQVIARSAKTLSDLDSAKYPKVLKSKHILRAVVDSGCTTDILTDEALFESITMYTPNSIVPTVMMGDDKTLVPVAGHGFSSYYIHGKKIRRHSLFVPALGSTCLLAVKQHISYQGCYFHAEAGETVLAYPSFMIYPHVGHEIDVLLCPAPISKEADFDESTATYINPSQKARKFKLRNKDHLPVRKMKLCRQEKSFDLISTKAKEVLPSSFNPSEKDKKAFIYTVKMKQLVPNAIIPKLATAGSIGYDISSAVDMIIQPGEIAKVSTGLATALPKGIYLHLAPRSSLALKHISVEGGIVDPDYRGDIKVLLKNNGSIPFTIHAGHRIAQMIFERAETPLIEIVQNLPSYENSTRNTGGFGSTGRGQRFSTLRVDNDTVLLKDNTKLDKSTFIKCLRVPIQGTPMTEEDIQEAATTAETFRINPLQELINNTSNNIRYHKPENSQDADSTDPVFNMQSAPIDPHHIKQHCIKSKHLFSQSNTHVRSTEAKIRTISQDDLLKSIGYLKPDTLVKNLKNLGQGTLRVSSVDKNPILDPGESATLKSGRKNKDGTSTPDNYEDIWHIDIGYGPCTGIGGIRYTLLAVNKKLKMRYIYGLKNLKGSLLIAIKQFVIDSGIPPKIIRTDFDKKILRGKVKAFLRDKGIKVQAGAPYRQDQNGLVERHWQTIVNMSRNWLRAAMLPTKYWFFAVKRACEVLNLMPTKIDGKITTPIEALTGKKVDYRQLFPMFSTAYIKQHRANGTNKNKFEPQTLKCILVGTCNDSDSLLFYHPATKQLLSCGDNFRLDPYAPAGPMHGEVYDGNFIFNLQSDLDEQIHQRPQHELNSTVYYQLSKDNYVQAKVLTIPINEENESVMIQLIESGDIIESPAEDLLDHDPAQPIEEPESNQACPLYPWLKHNAKVTVILPQLQSKPKQGFLVKTNDTWSFIPGRSRKKHKPIELPDFISLANSMVQNKKIFQGWRTRQTCLTARRVRATSNALASLIVKGKVSAKDLQDMTSPSSLLRHEDLDPHDQIIWDAAYKAEYDGLVDIDTWECISEEQYQNLKHTVKGIMPTMAISTIKYDGDGNPKVAKYRIVALGNLDPHDWSKEDCFAPVLSQLELRFLTALAVQHRCIPKSGDIKQAFCQSYLPKDENYILKPPPGCPFTPPGTYWKLKKTLYGLKRSPKHFYDHATTLLKKLGLKQHPFSPCIFYGTLIKGEAPIYLGLYVDDFIYFSPSKKTEEVFEQRFGSMIDIDFNGQIGHFLGINFKCKRHTNNDVSIHLSQEAFIDSICDIFGIDPLCNEPRTPYRSGLPVDTIPTLPPDTPENIIIKNRHLLQRIVGSLNWLTISTRPDIATITNLIAKYCNRPSPGHIEAAKWVLKYLKGTKTKGILFTTQHRHKVEAFVNFPLPTNKVTGICDSNWGPQDQSKPNPKLTEEIDLFKSRSVSGYLLWLGGPLHWSSKRQTITARSSAEAEIYATDECTKALLNLSFLMDGLKLIDNLMKPPTNIFNDNRAAVCWSKNTTTKGLRHIQIRENAVRESVKAKFINVKHCEGKMNPSDIFTKEDKDTNHFVTIVNLIMADGLPPDQFYSIEERRALTPLESRGVSSWDSTSARNQLSPLTSQ